MIVGGRRHISAAPGQEPCHYPVNPTWSGWPSSLPTWLHKGRFPSPWTQAGTCSPLRSPRACMSNPEGNEVGEMVEARQVTIFQVRSGENTSKGHPNSLNMSSLKSKPGVFPEGKQLFRGESSLNQHSCQHSSLEALHFPAPDQA